MRFHAPTSYIGMELEQALKKPVARPVIGGKVLAVSNTPLAVMSSAGASDANFQGVSFSVQGFGIDLNN